MSNSTELVTCHDDVSAAAAADAAVRRRYEGLVTVRTKAIKGKGAWFWAHLEPLLLPNAVKLKCLLCSAVFSASNPSRTASEHLKRATCPNFTLMPRGPISPQPISSSLPLNNNHNHSRKRSSEHLGDVVFTPVPQTQTQTQTQTETETGSVGQLVNSLSLVGSPGFCGEIYSHKLTQHQHVALSGGKSDVNAALAKKLKIPNNNVALSKEQVDSAVEFLSDWFHESCGAVSFASLEHPKFKAFLARVGLPAAMLQRELVSGARLDVKYNRLKAESEARISEAMFFQVACNGWESDDVCVGEINRNVVKFMVNLPNGSSVFHKAVFTNGGVVSSNYAEEVMWDAVTGVCGGNVLQRCVGIVADKYRAKALRSLESRNCWMVNVSCQLRGFVSLIKDFHKEHKLFNVVAENCSKVADFVNSASEVRRIFRKYKMQKLGYDAGLIQVSSSKCYSSKDYALVYAMLEDILTSSSILEVVVSDECYKETCLEDPTAVEVAGLIQSVGFWNELGAVYSFIKLIRGMAQEIEVERPLIGQCMPLWEELRTKVKGWCAKFNIDEGPVEKIVEKRFAKNYHPAMSAAFILDPQYLIRDTSGKYLPPFKFLTHEQQKDVDKLITRLVSREEAHVALMELMKWRTEGMDPLYAQAVQVKQQDPVTGKMKIANPQSSRLVWETCLSKLNVLAKVAVRLIFLHATSFGFKCNWSSLKGICVHRHSRIGLEKAEKMIFVAAHAKLDRRDFSNDEERESELFAAASGDDDMLNEGLSGAPTV